MVFLVSYFFFLPTSASTTSSAGCDLRTTLGELRRVPHPASFQQLMRHFDFHNGLLYEAKMVSLVSESTRRCVPILCSFLLQIFNPATEDKVGDVHLAGPRDVDLAVEAASKAFPAWSATPAHVRADCIRRLAGLVAGEAFFLAEVRSPSLHLLS